jgi:hypothetical protein
MKPRTTSSMLALKSAQLKKVCRNCSTTAALVSR